MNAKRWLDGRFLILAIAAGFGIRMGVLSNAERTAQWHALGVPALDLSFGDLRVITSAWECSRGGLDVLATNPCDPWARPMNYPRLWLLPSVFDVGQSATTILGIVLCLGFLGALLLIVGRLGWSGTIAYGAALMSPAVLLAVERGNNDLAVFALCAVGLALMQRWGTTGTAIGLAVIVLATALKLYPIFGLVVLVPRTRLALVALAVAALYIFAILPDLSLISKATPRPGGLAYGTEPVASVLGVAPIAVAVAAVLAALTVSTFGVIFRTARATVPSLERDAFVVGSAAFLGTFLIGSDWAYRLILLLLTVPQLLQWMRIAEARWLGAHLLVAELALLWLTATTARTGLGLNEFLAVSLGLFAVLGGLLAGILWIETSPARSYLIGLARRSWRPSPQT